MFEVSRAARRYSAGWSNTGTDRRGTSGVDLRNGDEHQDDRDYERENHHRGDHLRLLVIGRFSADREYEKDLRLTTREGYLVSVSDASDSVPLIGCSGGFGPIESRSPRPSS